MFQRAYFRLLAGRDAPHPAAHGGNLHESQYHMPLWNALCGGGVVDAAFPLGQPAPAQGGYWHSSHVNFLF